MSSVALLCPAMATPLRHHWYVAAGCASAATATEKDVAGSPDMKLCSGSTVIFGASGAGMTPASCGSAPPPSPSLPLERSPASFLAVTLNAQVTPVDVEMPVPGVQPGEAPGHTPVSASLSSSMPIEPSSRSAAFVQLAVLLSLYQTSYGFAAASCLPFHAGASQLSSTMASDCSSMVGAMSCRFDSSVYHVGGPAATASTTSVLLTEPAAFDTTQRYTAPPLGLGPSSYSARIKSSSAPSRSRLLLHARSDVPVAFSFSQRNVSGGVPVAATASLSGVPAASPQPLGSAGCVVMRGLVTTLTLTLKFELRRPSLTATVMSRAAALEGLAVAKLTRRSAAWNAAADALLLASALKRSTPVVALKATLAASMPAGGAASASVSLPASKLAPMLTVARASVALSTSTTVAAGATGSAAAPSRYTRNSGAAEPPAPISGASLMLTTSMRATWT